MQAVKQFGNTTTCQGVAADTCYACKQ